MLQLDWCARGIAETPWFPEKDDAQVQIASDGPIVYADPAACVMLAAWARHHIGRGQPPIIDDSIKSPYAWRIGLLSALAGRNYVHSRSTERMFPATCIPSPDAIEEHLNRIRRILHLDTESADAITYCLSELLRNVFEHSASPYGAFIAAGYFPTKQRVTIAVADLGITVPVHVKRKYAPEQSSELDDAVALRIALEPRVSGSDDPNRNAGLGLYMTRRIADLTGGKFWMLTGNYSARNDGDANALGGHGNVEITRIQNRWVGTVAALTFYPERVRSFNFSRAISVAHRQLEGGRTALSTELFTRKASLPNSEVVFIRPDVSNIAQNKDAAAQLRDTSIMPALRDNKLITLDFAGVALTTQSFMHALLAEPIRYLGMEALQQRVRFRACSTQVKEIVWMVIGYVIDA